MPLEIKRFNSLVGGDSFVRCNGKERTDPAIVNLALAENHLFSGGTVGWWVKTGYIVVDIDEGKDNALKIIKALGLKTLMCKTPKGIHLYFKTDKDYPQKIGMTLPCGLKCDFRCANKGYVMLPYGMDGRSFNKCDSIMEMPLEWTPIPNRKESLLGKKDGDGRNATLFAHLMAYKNRNATDEQIVEMAGLINTYIFGTPMPLLELEKVIENTKKYSAQSLGDNPYLIYNLKGTPSQVNNRAIADYFVNTGQLFVIGGECYQYKGGIYEEASASVRNTMKEMIALDSLITQSRIVECYRLLADDTRIQRLATDLNSDRNFINFKNGVWDISKGKLVPHDSKYLQTLQIPHGVKKASKPWKDTKLYKFFSSKTGITEENIEMITDYMAYCLTLDYGLKTFMVLQGQSNTGKSVLIRFLETMVGRENTSALSMQELSMRFYPSQLYNRLLNSCADNGSLPLNSIENLKKITGGDQIMHEKKGKEPFFFVPFCKLIFSFNQMPLQLEEKSNAFYKRIRVLSMQKELCLNNTYVDDLCSLESIAEVIPHLLSRLPLKFIPATSESDRLVEALRQDSDSIHAFLTNCCETERSYWVETRGMWEAYCLYCMDTGKEGHKKHTFMRHLRTQGLKDTRHPKTREPCWRGIRLVKGSM